MGNSGRLAVVSLIIAVIACLIAAVSMWESRRCALRQSSVSSTSAEWLSGSSQERFLKIEHQLRGLDQAMAEIGYRYGELLVAGRERNWDYATYQAQKIDLSLKLALERRPKRASSAQSFLHKDLPAVVQAIQHKDGQRMDGALERLHNSCVACHQAENVQFFREVVEGIRSRANR